MTLRKRLFWLFVPLLLLTLLSAFWLSERILLSRFDHQDRALLLNDAERLRSALNFMLKNNLNLLSTYSGWDDSYEFMLGNRPDFARSNLDEQSLALLNFDFMVFLDNQQHVVTEQWLPPDLSEMLSSNQQHPSDYDSLRQDILQLGRALTLLDQASPSELGRGQLLLVQGTPLLLVVSPISNNHSTIAPVGNIVAGHFLDRQRFKSLQQLVDGDLRLGDPPTDTSQWLPLPIQPDSLSKLSISPRELQENRQHVELLLANDLNEPALTLHIDKDRRLFQEGRQAIWFFLMQAVAVGAGATVMIYLCLEFWILRRLQYIHREVAKVGPENPLPRLEDSRNDELGQLANALNLMFERFMQSESRDQLILDSINDGFFELDLHGNITTLNRALEQMLGYSRAEMLGRSYKEALAEEDIPRARSLVERVLQNSSDNQFAAPFKRRDGSVGHFETRLTLFHDRQGQIAGCRGILRDTSEQMAYQNKLIDMAYRDPLTGLGNRKAFSEELQRSLDLMLRQERSLALLYIDLDRFKQVNDQYGHDIGDALLISIAQRLQSSLRQPDHVYRLGGDEFTVLLTDADPESAMKLAERLLRSLGQPFIDDRLVIDFVTPSIGIALFPQHAKQAESLIKAADIAMYEAKQQRNRACLYTPPELSTPT